MSAALTAFLTGTLFALGLGLSGMTDPANVTGFLDVTGQWRPQLALVMAAALSVHLLLRRLFARRLVGGGGPSASSRIDRRLLGGAALFGAGWGLQGYCPGPALVGVVTGAPRVWVFVAAMLAGMALHQLTLAALRRPMASEGLGSSSRMDETQQG